MPSLPMKATSFRDGKRISVVMPLFPVVLEDGTIVDIPKGTLREPPPKPAEFAYLQHYYESKSSPGTTQDLASCSTLEEKVDVLADEVAALKRLYAGYTDSFVRLVRALNSEHEKIKEDLEDVKTTYSGLKVLGLNATQAEQKVE